MSVISIRRDVAVSDVDLEVVDVAYRLWLARAFQGGSPEDALLTALEEVKGRSSMGLFLVPRRMPMKRGLDSPAR